MNPNLKRGEASIVDMTIRERAAIDMMTALVTAGYYSPLAALTDERRRVLAKEAYCLVDALIIAGADTRETKLMAAPPMTLEQAGYSSCVEPMEPPC